MLNLGSPSGSGQVNGAGVPLEVADRPSSKQSADAIQEHTPVTPVTPSKTAFSNGGKNHGVTGGVTRPTETDERGAFIEIGAGVPLEWAKSFARLEQTAPRLGLSEPIWRTIIDDAGRFLDVWTDAAIRAGWLPDDVFEIQVLPDTAPFKVGLAQIISGGQVLQIAGQKVTIRRPHWLYRFECDGQAYTGGIGRFDDGRIAEIFINGAKVGTAAETNAQDAAIVASLALQHGCPIETIHHALARSGGSAGPLVTLLDEVDRRS
jgi:hypothetical protein